jgi:hypothetical protein
VSVRDDFFKALEAWDSELTYFVLTLEDSVVAFWTENGSENVRRLNEAQYRGTPIGGPYSARVDRPATPSGMPDLHVFLKGTQLFAMYSDGTRRHGKPGYRIPNRVAHGIRQHFPDFQLPDDGILEALEDARFPILEG